MRTPAPKRIIGYARVSSVEQAIGSSLQDQQRVIATYAQEKRGIGMHRMHVETESGAGERIERRLEMQALMASVQPGDLVLCDKIDRWSRDPEFAYGSIRKILEKGASFYAVGEDIDPSTPDGDSKLGFRILFAREEHKRIKQRMVGTRKTLRAQGYYAEGNPPHGYRRQDAKGVTRHILVVDEGGADRIRDIFRRCVEGESLEQIAGVVGFSKAYVLQILQNRTYLGEMRDVEGNWALARHPAIIDPATFLAALEGREARRLGERRARDDSSTGTWWLRDLARCAHCQGKLVSSYGRGSRAVTGYHGYFRCYRRCVRAYVNVATAETQCDPLVVARLESLRDTLASARIEAPLPPVANVASLRARLAAKRERYLESFAEGFIVRDELRAKLSALDTERTRLDALEQGPALPSSAERRGALRSVEAMRRAWGRASPKERRIIVGAVAKAAYLAAGTEPRFDWIEIVKGRL